MQIRRSVGHQGPDEMHALDDDGLCYDNRQQSLQHASRVVRHGILRYATPTQVVTDILSSHYHCLVKGTHVTKNI